jgi:flavin-binding protein dodecin
MSVAKTIEVSADSSSSFEDAIKQGVTKAGESVRGIQEVWVKSQKVLIENNQIKTYRVQLAVTFVLD